MPVRSVSVCLITYRRPDQLRTALESIRSLEQPGEAFTWTTTLVVDNDPDRSAEVICAEFTDLPGFAYRTQPNPGIAAARNTVMAECGTDFVAFFDDDEEVSSQWLAALTHRQAETGATAVVGPVDYRFERPPPAWVEASKTWAAEEPTPGADAGWLTTNNVLLRTDVGAALGGAGSDAFDNDFGLSGGSDYQLGIRMQHAGLRIAFAPEATAVEWVPPARTTRPAITRRLLRDGNIMSRADLSVRSGPSKHVARLRHILSGLARVAGGTLRAVVRLPSGGVPGAASGARTSLIGTGQVLGAFGVVVSSYKRRD